MHAVCDSCILRRFLSWLARAVHSPKMYWTSCLWASILVSLSWPIPFGTDFLSATTRILLLVISLACVRVFLPCTVPALNLMQISIYQTAQTLVLLLCCQELIQRNISPSPLCFSPFEFSQRRDWFFGTLAIGIIPNVGGLACEACDVGLRNHLSRGEKQSWKSLC